MEAAGGPEHSTSSVTFNLIGYTPRRNKYFHEFRGQGAAPNACRHRQGPSYTKVARNLTRSVLKNASKRCNSNDVNSTFEILEGELRATLMRRDGSWPDNEPTRRATHQRPGGAGVEGAGGTGERKRAWLPRPRGRWRGHAPKKSHVIRLDEHSTKPQNVAIPTI